MEKCPRKCMLTTKPDKVALILEDKCKGCHLCAKACPFDAIDGEPKQLHKVNGNCRGCGLCQEKCKLNAVEMVPKKPDAAGHEEAM